VAAYSFNEGTGTTVHDATGNGNNGTLQGGTSWTTSGRYGNAISFNGTNAYVNVPNSSSVQLTTAMTLEAWVNPSERKGVWRDVIYKGNDNYYLEADSTNGKPATGGTFGPPLFGTGALTTNAWTHLAGTYDGTTLRLYVNGTQVSNRAQTGPIAISTNALQIGGDSIYGQYFPGKIDEIRIYNRALSATEIQSDMNTPVTP
jgi:Concanavalin A-like lectin/glucanases superfamily